MWENFINIFYIQHLTRNRRWYIIKNIYFNLFSWFISIFYLEKRLFYFSSLCGKKNFWGKIRIIKIQLEWSRAANLENRPPQRWPLSWELPLPLCFFFNRKTKLKRCDTDWFPAPHNYQFLWRNHDAKFCITWPHKSTLKDFILLIWRKKSDFIIWLPWNLMYQLKIKY